jgi:hypothetical protein
LARIFLRKRNCISLSKPSLDESLLLRGTKLSTYCRRTKRSPRCNWSSGLRSTRLKGPLATLRSSIDRIVVLLSQNITDKLIESGTLTSAHGLHQLGTEATLETGDLLSIRLGYIPCKVIEGL